MRTNALKKKIADGVCCVGGWAAIPSAFATEIYAAQGWDSVTLDMQHGSLDINDVVPMLQAINAGSEATPLVRVPWNDPSYIMRVLDAGAFGIICPMINTEAEAEALVRGAATRRWASAASGRSGRPSTAAPTTGSTPTTRCCCSP